MLSALIRTPATAAIRVIRVPTLIAVRVRAGSLWMVLRMILGRMSSPRSLHALLPELPGRVHAPRAVRPLRRRRLRAQQQQGRKKQPRREREKCPAATHFHFTVMQLSHFGQFFGRFVSLLFG